MLPTISIHPLNEVHEKQALVKEKMMGTGFGVSRRTCLNRVDVKVSNIQQDDWDVSTVTMTLHLQDNGQQVVTTGHPDWPYVFSMGTSGSGTVTPFNTSKSLGKPTATGDAVVDFVFALNALSTRQQGRDPLFFLRFTLWAHGSPCAQVDTDGFLNKARKCKSDESHQRKSIETRDFTATKEHRSKLNELKRASEALEDEETRTDALRQRIDQLTNQNNSLLHENSALRRQLQAQPALCGGADSPRPPAASPYKGVFTLAVPPGAQGGQEVRMFTPMGMVTAVVPAGLKAGDIFRIRVSQCRQD